MGTLVSILDKKACGGEAVVNTGKLGCLSLFGAPTHLILTRKGWKIPVAQEFNIAYIIEHVQKGNFIPIIDASSFEDLSAEDTYTTNTSGVKRLNLDGLVELKFKYEEGHEFYKELSKLKSFKNYDVILGDDGGNWMFAVNSDGTSGGFSLGHVTPERRTFKVQGGDSESKTLSLQFIDRIQYDINYAIAHFGTNEITFTPQEVPVINGAELGFDTPPADTDVTFIVSAVMSSDRSTLILGLLIANFIYQVNGSTVVPSSVVETNPGLYTFTVAAVATGEVLTVDLIDAILNVEVAVDADGLLYRSDIITTTVLA